MPFAYPLKAEALSTGLLFYVAFGILFALYRITSGGEAAFCILWLAVSASSLLVYTALLFDYGMEILGLTAMSKQDPPVFSASPARIEQSWQRLVRQLIVLGLGSAAAGQLHSLGLGEVAWVVWVVLFLLLPAIFINNTLFDSILSMINPVALAATLRNLRWANVPILGLLTLIVALYWICLTGPLLVFLLLFPLVVYCQFLFFHVLGLCVRAREDLFFAQVDFKADRKELAAISDNLADINRELSEAHEWMRAGQHAQVLEKVEVLLRRRGWTDFEVLFSYTSQWFDRGPAVHLCRLYLNSPEALSHPMRALALAEWALAQEAGLTLSQSANLRALAEQALTRGQCRVALQLIENHLARQPDSLHRAALVSVALQLAAEKLKDEAQYARLKSAWHS